MFRILAAGGIVMIPLIFCSFLAIAIIIERMLFFNKINVDEDKMISRLKETINKKHFDEAISICENNPSPVTNLAKVGIEHRNYDSKFIKDMVTDAANMEVPKLERFLSSLGTIATLSPLLGLLGSVLGIISSFKVLSDFGSVGDISVLSKGVAEALVSTAAGIIVAIPALIFYNYLIAKVNHIIIRLENRVNEIIKLLEGEKNAL